MMSMQYMYQPEVDDTPADYQFALTGSSSLTLASGIIEPVIGLKFDPCEELLWAANESGKIASYFGSSLDVYTSFTVNQPVRALEVSEDAVIVLFKSSMMGFKRRGILSFEYSCPHFEDLTCVANLPMARNSLIIGGHQPKIVQYDVNRQKEQRLVLLKDNTDCTIVRVNDRFIVTADSNGILTLRSIDSVEPIHSIVAHTGGIADLDVTGNRIITCGYTSRSGAPFSDPFLKVYDVRNLKALLPLSILFPPILCRFADAFSDGRLIVGSKYGHVISADLNEPQHNILYQCCNQALPVCMDVSSSRQYLAVAENTGSILLFGDRENSVINIDSWPTIFPSVEDCLPPMAINNHNSCLACVPTPLPPAHGYCSDFWPEESLRREFRKPRPIPPEVMESARKTHNVVYAKNPNAYTPFGCFNVCPYDLSTNAGDKESMEDGVAVEERHSALSSLSEAEEPTIIVGESKAANGEDKEEGAPTVSAE